MNNKILFGLSCAMLLLSCKVEPDPVEEDTSSSENSTIPYQELPETLRHVQTVNADDDRVIYNPDMGFYSAEDITIHANGSLSTTSTSTATFLKNGAYKSSAKFDLVHLKVDIAEFNNTETLNLSALDSLLKSMKTKGQTAIIRFAYDKGYKGKTSGDEQSVFEPTNFEIVKKHISQICTLVKNNKNVITAVECGMVGPWGEMHTTNLAEATVDNKQCYYIVEIMKAFLNGLGNCEMPFLVRQPRFIYNYLNSSYKKGSTNIPSVTFDKTSPLYRIGMYNDGYLGTESDLGTFKVNDSDGRKLEINWLEKFLNHTPYGGEMCDNVDDYGTSKWKAPLWEADLAGSIKEMYKVKLSFLNIGWNDRVLTWADRDDHTFSYTFKVKENGVEKTVTRNITANNKYKSQKFFQYLLRHMGYRYTVTSSVLLYPDDFSSFNVELKYKNFGFANLPYHRTKVLRLIFKNKGTGEETQIKRSDKFIGAQSATSENGVVSEPEETELRFSAGDLSGLESGDYDVYLKVCDNDTSGSYPIQFANGKNDWNDSLKANKIGSFTKS